jgi:hypothetical protein
MDIISFLLGYTSGKNGSNGNVSGIEEIDLALDEINGEVIGESLFQVTFVGENGQVIHVEQVYDGYDCPDPVESGTIDTPTKEGTKYYGWKFSGWSLTDGGEADSNVLKNISSDLTLYAAFTEYEILIASGYCGSGNANAIKWSLNPDYVLRVALNSGSSATIANYFNGSPDGDYAPWHSYTEMINSVIIGEGIRGVGMYNFTGCTALTSIEFPSTLRAIGNEAFNGCTNLTSVTIPAAVKYIYNKAFYECTSLESAIFEAKSGWGIYNSGNLVQALTETEVADAATMAEYLANTASGDFRNANVA